MVVKSQAGAYEGPNEDDMGPFYFEAKGKPYGKKGESRISREYEDEQNPEPTTCNYDCDDCCKYCK